jgi:dolichol-phosphate mannosyltransferase
VADDLGPVLVVVPTYNEAANLAGVVGRLRGAVPEADVLVVDDGSPDGTGTVAEHLAAADGRVRVLHRTAKEGLGPAYVAGFGWGLQRDYGVLVQMDADGSHLPEQLPMLLGALPGADVVIGSRWVPGGSVQNWPRRREALSRAGNLYARAAIRVPVRDATAGFRVWRREALQSVDLGTVASTGYCFQVDLTRRAVRGGLRVREMPIRFVERTAGESKMSRSVVREALWRVTVWGVRDRWPPTARRTGSRTARRTAGGPGARRRLRWGREEA